MEPLQILERYYNAFIEQKDPKVFFIGMTDYLDYGDTIPEFDWITSQISLMPKPLTDKLEKEQEVALAKIKPIHAEISAYVSEKKIENAGNWNWG